MTGLARAVAQGDISRLVYARAVPWRGERPLVSHARPRWLLAPPFFPWQSPQRRARMQDRHVSLAWRWRLVVVMYEERHSPCARDKEHKLTYPELSLVLTTGYTSVALVLRQKHECSYFHRKGRRLYHL
jgi:hypothetical protein